MIGPYASIDLGGGRSVDLYLLRFGEDGSLLSPRTRDIVLERARDASDVFLFSHGWNNTFADASQAYRQFVEGYAAQRARLGLPLPAGYRPMLVGMIWPSTSFVLPWEQGPAIAGSPVGPEASEREELLQLLGESLDREAFAELTELVDGVHHLQGEAASRAAALVAQALEPGDGADDPETPPAGGDLLTAWQVFEHGAAAPAPASGHGVAVIPGVTPPAASQQPQAAGGVPLDPRALLRLGSLWKMKARAGKVGAHGVAPLLSAILDGSDARVHLVGHSFGARVMLSAATLARATRKVHSLLLLQPAVNRWCFADQVTGRGVPGGYRPVLDRVQQPIVTTMSRHDVPLHEAFHLAVRDASLGEPTIAAIGDTDRYGALGGYGPAGVELSERQAVREGTPYDFGAHRIVVLDGDVAGVKVSGVDAQAGQPAIAGHGDVSNTVTWWALHTLTGT